MIFIQVTNFEHLNFQFQYETYMGHYFILLPLPTLINCKFYFNNLLVITQPNLFRTLQNLLSKVGLKLLTTDHAGTEKTSGTNYLGSKACPCDKHFSINLLLTFSSFLNLSCSSFRDFFVKTPCINEKSVPKTLKALQNLMVFLLDQSAFFFFRLLHVP